MKVRTVEPEKFSLLGNSCVTRNSNCGKWCFLMVHAVSFMMQKIEKLLGEVFFVMSVPKPYNAGTCL
jgi:hypothetical protein